MISAEGSLQRHQALEEDIESDGAQGDTESSSMIPLMRLYTARGNFLVGTNQWLE